MSLKKNSPAAYNDVKYVMDIALKKPGLRYECRDAGRATHFKQRCNTYRNLLRQMAQEQVVDIPGYRAETAYDILVISQINERGEPDRKGNILIFKHLEVSGKLIDPDTGEEIPLNIGLPIVDRET